MFSPRLERTFCPEWLALYDRNNIRCFPISGLIYSFSLFELLRPAGIVSPLLL